MIDELMSPPDDSSLLDGEYVDSENEECFFHVSSDVVHSVRWQGTQSDVVHSLLTAPMNI